MSDRRPSAESSEDVNGAFRTVRSIEIETRMRAKVEIFEARKAAVQAAREKRLEARILELEAQMKKMPGVGPSVSLVPPAPTGASAESARTRLRLIEADRDYERIHRGRVTEADFAAEDMRLARVRSPTLPPGLVCSGRLA